MIRAILILAFFSGTALAAPCCGPIMPAGQHLSQVLDASNVEHLWLAREHVNWQTGMRDRPIDTANHRHVATHCSAFIAAIGERLGVYVLRPPQHGPVLLANAQNKWLSSTEGQAQGWRHLVDARSAQSLANEGKLVLISYANPDPHRPGHIVIVRPSEKSLTDLANDGPEIIQAGMTNHNHWQASSAFAYHPGSWPNGVSYFVHDVQ
ncbi:hypothetical protein GW590_11835 [Rahnella sp. SAP-1]|uniref:CHAP domain-containing protein n=1 Tax=Rouxiella aceris TaxID=2703884 RepID=A0A848MKF3_9GAMM|nr:hypothetical protein [Rouxiella aceris]NMP27550.1 hypothetical protein [Rouxiella aceris]